MDETFPEQQFHIEGFSPPYRRDRNDKGGGLLLFVREYVPSRKINVELSPQIEAIVIEINFNKKKWILIGSYNPHKSMIDTHLESVSKLLDEFYKRYENFIFMGDFNSEMCEEPMNNFCSLYNLKNLIKSPTCIKNPDNPALTSYLPISIGHFKIHLLLKRAYLISTDLRLLL